MSQTQYALPIDFRDLKKLEAEIEQRLEEDKTNENYRFVNSEIKKALRAREDMKASIEVMNRTARTYNVEAYIDKVVLPLPNQDIADARYLVGVKTAETKLSSSKKVESYYFAVDIKNDAKKIATELCVAFTGRQNPREELV